ncbi:MAG: deoxyribose-phosphate aldolase [Acidobacteria bacterium 13_1_20CM_2_55_15]|nr:MAG: deoxyribose-phosphate aldolase [Acidobacteria bacterium 13_1_40CM_3_56_11]OLE88098.1 MAG: deoxyribose-phosphate aldolase [Acidobacteria bacterium 13_1_20CM_2_55_15]PYR71209.1 MAG: deoxyribose-phosphate aldolase [Acidobacteriota bacterium]PYS11283.1 MAG: deoxyribose-phosphate aldolase [Acidobacteriota bacterium]
MKSDFGRHIDHTLLRPIATTTDIRRLCTEAIEYGMAAVCVFPSYVPMAREILKESRVKIATVIAFPFGVTYTEIKEAEMRTSAARGADEMDFVINIAALKSGDDRAIEQEMEYLTSKARTIGVRTKFIIETAYLTDDEKVRVCKVANRVKPDFMKTSTGYGPSGATVEDVRMMRSSLLPEIQIKAAGGIRSYAEALQLLQAGASRLGTSSGIKIIEEASKL